MNRRALLAGVSFLAFNRAANAAFGVPTLGSGDPYRSIDGRLNAPKAGHQEPTILNGYPATASPNARKVWPNVNSAQPPWQVAGVDYPVGYDTTLYANPAAMKDPNTINNGGESLPNITRVAAANSASFTGVIAGTGSKSAGTFDILTVSSLTGTITQGGDLFFSGSPTTPNIYVMNYGTQGTTGNGGTGTYAVPTQGVAVSSRAMTQMTGNRLVVNGSATLDGYDFSRSANGAAGWSLQRGTVARSSTLTVTNSYFKALNTCEVNDIGDINVVFRNFEVDGNAGQPMLNNQAGFPGPSINGSGTANIQIFNSGQCSSSFTYGYLHETAFRAIWWGASPAVSSPLFFHNATVNFCMFKNMGNIPFYSGWHLDTLQLTGDSPNPCWYQLNWNYNCVYQPDVPANGSGYINFFLSNGSQVAYTVSGTCSYNTTVCPPPVSGARLTITLVLANTCTNSFQLDFGVGGVPSDFVPYMPVVSGASGIAASNDTRFVYLDTQQTSISAGTSITFKRGTMTANIQCDDFRFAGANGGSQFQMVQNYADLRGAWTDANPLANSVFFGVSAAYSFTTTYTGNTAFLMLGNINMRDGIGQSPGNNSQQPGVWFDTNGTPAQWQAI